jgi:hypothetical protein
MGSEVARRAVRTVFVIDAEVALGAVGEGQQRLLGAGGCCPVAAESSPTRTETRNALTQRPLAY